MTSHSGTPPCSGLRFSARIEGGYTVATLSGELDVACSPVLREQLLGVLRPQASRLVIDLSQVTFCDASGLAVLVGTGRRAGLLGGLLRLAAPAPTVVAALRLSGLRRQFDIFSTVQAATRQPETADRMADSSAQIYTRGYVASAGPTQVALLPAMDATDAHGLREAVTALLVQADAWRDADPNRKFTSSLLALARARACDDHTALAKAARSLLVALTKYPLTHSPAVATTASDLRRLISAGSSPPVLT